VQILESERREADVRTCAAMHDAFAQTDAVLKQSDLDDYYSGCA
jgi:hypothetical protein